VGISGGVVLGSETDLTAVDPVVYATASQDEDADPSLSPSITITFSVPVESVSVKIFNGLPTSQTYNITTNNPADLGSATLMPNDAAGNSGTLTIVDPSGIKQAVITSADSTEWDFSIDNINFNFSATTTVSQARNPIVAPATYDASVLNFLSELGDLVSPSSISTVLFFVQFMGSIIYSKSVGVLQDPFDPNYQQEYTPTFAQLPTIQPDSTITQQTANDANTALSDLSKAATFVQAMEVTLNRLDSAMQAGDQASVALQSADLDTWLTLSGSSLAAAGKDLDTLAHELVGVTLPTVTTQELNSFLSNIKTNGFSGLPQQEQALANLFGLSFTDEQSIVNELLSANLGSVPSSVASALQQVDTGVLGLASVYGGTAPEADATLPAVAVEGSMYNAVGSAQEITLIATEFLPAQIANAVQFGLNAQVYSCEAVGLAFAFGDENGGTGFNTNFGPANTSMPATHAGDMAFAAAAASTIFGSAATANTPGAILQFVSNWEAFYTAHGVPGIANASATQIDLAARGAAWGDAVGVALANNLGPLPGLTNNFLQDAVQGTAIYSASLASQPQAAAAQGAAAASLANAADHVQLIGVAAHPDHTIV
jgi:hypothetical protein